MSYATLSRGSMTGKNSAIIPTAGRLSSNQSPMGAKHCYFYNSPHYKPNSGFNYWKDIQMNVQTRNKWDNSVAADQGGDFGETFSQMSGQQPGRRTASLGARSVTMFQQNQKAGSAIPVQHQARYLYSQIDLGSDDDGSSRSASPASSLSRSRINLQSNVILGESDNQSQRSNTRQGINNIAQNQGNQGVDINMKRKQDSKLKWFTSHIPELPGPQTEVIKNIGKEYKQDQKQQTKLAEEKNVLKNRKYIQQVKPTENYQHYKKEIKSEWNRNPNNEFTKKQREKQLYTSNKLY